MWLLLLTACVRKAEVDALRFEVAMLNARVAALESVDGRPAPDAAGEAAAAALLRDAQTALEAGDSRTARAALERIVGEYPGTAAAGTAERLLPELRLVGEPAAPLAVSTWYQGQGTYDAPLTLVVFFETWCPHCTREMPEVEARYEKWRAMGLGVVGLTKVTRSATDTSVREFIRTHHLQFPVGKELDGQVSTGFAVTGIPAAALVKGGVVVWRGHPARLTDELLAGYLGG